MSFTTITDDELIGMGVTGLDDTPELSTEAMQAQFDEYPQFLKDKFKTHITEEEANTAAGNIGAVIPDELDNVTDEHIQPILDELATRAKDLKDWQDNADANFHPAELNTDVFHADDTVVTAPTVDTLDVSDNVATTAFVDAKMQAIGAGDMAKSVYDPNDRNVVETAYRVDNSYVNEITESMDTYPEPEAGDKVKDIVGKMMKYSEDLKAELVTTAEELENKALSTTDYGTCTTAASTASKEITVSNDDWFLRTGSIICVLFSNTNTSQNPTFNVNNTGAVSVSYDGSVITDSNISYAGTSGRPMFFMYDGTNWVFVGWSKDWKREVTAAQDTADKTQAMVAPIETGDTSSQSYAIGDRLVWNGLLYKAKAAITAGNAFSIGGNIELSDTVEEQLATLNSDLSGKANKATIATITVTTDGVNNNRHFLNDLIYRLTNALNALPDGAIIIPYCASTYFGNREILPKAFNKGDTITLTTNVTVINASGITTYYESLTVDNSKAFQSVIDGSGNVTINERTNAIPSSGTDWTLYYLILNN